MNIARSARLVVTAACFVEIAPDLDGDEADQRANRMPNAGSTQRLPGRFSRVVCCESGHNQINAACDEISSRKIIRPSMAQRLKTAPISFWKKCAAYFYIDSTMPNYASHRGRVAANISPLPLMELNHKRHAN